MAVDRVALHTSLPLAPDSLGLADSISKINDLFPVGWLRLEYGVPAGEPGWHRCDDLLSPGSTGLAAWHDRLLEWLHAEYGHAPERTAAGFLRWWYLCAIATSAAMLFHHQRRVPSLRPSDLLVRISPEGRPDVSGVAVLSDEFACLPGDPAEGTSNTTTVASPHALAALLRARFAGHAARFIASYRPKVRFGRHALWATATDALDTGLWMAGQLGGDEGAGVADAALVLPEATKPFTSASTLRCHSVDGSPCWSRRRESCCFSYLVNDGEACADCPRTVPKR